MNRVNQINQHYDSKVLRHLKRATKNEQELQDLHSLIAFEQDLDARAMNCESKGN